MKRYWKLLVPMFALSLVVACSGGQDINPLNMEEPAGVDDNTGNGDVETE
ncbi:hypothetical protein [Bacillus sp. FSL K6-3431]